MRNTTRKILLAAGVSALAVMSVGLAAHAQDTTPKTSDDTSAAKIDDTVVVVTARRKALKSAIEIKKNSDTIVDSIVADEAGQLPDTSITEVLQRVSGVTMSRYSVGRGGQTPNFQIEGTGISVRGLPYNSSTLNGRQAFSANGANALSWGDVTPELMAGVDVYKASRADLIEGGTSSVDLKTHMPFDYRKPEFDLSLGASYGDAAKKTSPQASALYTRRFDTKYGEMGLLFDVAHSVYDSQDSDAQLGRYTMENNPNVAAGQSLVPTGYSWSQSKHTRTRDGLYAAFQWKPKDDLTLSSTFFYSQNKNRDESHSGGWGYDPNSSTENIPQNATFDSAGAMQGGNLYVGATGASTPIFGWGGNNWLYQYWDPSDPNYSYISGLSNNATILNADCRSQYGSVQTSQPNINWGNWDAPGMFYCQTSDNAVGLNLGGNTSYGEGISSTMDFSESFDWRPSDSLRVRGALQYVDSRTNSLSMYAGITQSDSHLTSASFDATKDIPTLGGFDATALVNTDTAYFNSFNYNGNDNRGTMLAANLDADYNLGDDHFFKSVSVGVRATDRRERDDFVGTYWAPISEGWVPYYAYLTGPNSHGTVSPSDYELYNFAGYFGGKTQSPGTVLVPSMSMMETLDWAHLASMSVDVAQGGKTTEQYYHDSIDQGTGITNTNIQNRAAYVQAKFGSNGFGFVPAFTGNIGVRVVNEVLRGQGNLAISGGNAFYLDLASLSQSLSGADVPTYQVPISSTPRSKKYGYTRVLPSFNVKFDLPSKLVLRMAASESMSPPNLGDIRPGGSITATLGSILVPSGDGTTTTTKYYLQNMYSQSGTGSDMKPVMIDSADVSLEWYPKDGVYSYLDLFHKKLTDQDLFQDYAQTQPTTLLDASNNNTPVTLDLPYYYVQNKSVAEAAKINGFELGGRTFFDSLPGPFKGLGLNGSVTYVDSSNPAALANSVVGPFALPGNTNGVPANANTDFGKMPYFGMSKWSYNVELLYSKGPWNARLAYNWHSKQLLSTSGNPLSYIGRGASGGEICTACLSDPVTHGHVWDMVPQWSADAGYLDFSLDYKINSNMSFGIQANNLTNTLSKTLQEPLPGVFERLDTYQSDRRINAYLRVHY